ncbi:MAG: SDR family oxidoreductase [Nitriliruptoraceae bacterium]
MSAPTILVTGASGNVGRSVAAELLARGQRVRAADRQPAPAAGPPGPLESVHLDLTDPDTFGPALYGVDRVFLIRPPAIARVGSTINPFIDAAVAAGVSHIVFSSVAGAERNRIVPHHRIETHLTASGLPWTMLRPGFFAQNLATAYRTDIRDHDRLHLPAGQGRVAFIDTRDLGELAGRILADPGPHAGRGYTLTGPRAVTFDEVAALLTDALGREIRYEPASILGYLRHLGAEGLPLAQRLVQTVLHAGLRRGDAEEVDRTLADLLGRPPRSIAEYIADHVHLWRREDRDGR